jgi:periplasmic divalent cation tolerance protein
MTELVVALTTVPADFDAPVTSIYIWEGIPQVDREQQLVMKTAADATDALLDFLRTRHPYDVPEFIVLPIVDGSEDYLSWIEKSVGPQRES